MSIFTKIKEAILGKPVTGVAIITDVEEVEEFLESIADEALAKNKNIEDAKEE